MRVFQAKSACNGTATHRVKFDQSNSPLALSYGAFIVSVWMIRGLP